MEERDRRRHIEDERKSELNKILAFGNEGLGVIETESDDAAEARIKKDMTREKP